MPLQNPLLEPLLVVPQRQVPVLRVAQFQRVARIVLVRRVDEFLGRQRGPTLLTLVTIGSLSPAARASAHDVAVGEKLPRHCVAVLLLHLLHQFAVIIELAEEVRGKLVMDGTCGTAVDVERDAEVLERLFDDAMIAVHDILHGDALLLGTDGHGHAMLVTASDEEHLASLQPEVTHIDICGHIDASQMSDVDGSVGVGKCRCHGSSFELLFHI